MSNLNKNEIERLLKENNGSAAELLKELSNTLKTSQEYSKMFTENSKYAQYLSNFERTHPQMCALIKNLHQQQNTLRPAAETFLTLGYGERLNKPFKK